jgi:hypothetical protein
MTSSTPVLRPAFRHRAACRRAALTVGATAAAALLALALAGCGPSGPGGTATSPATGGATTSAAAPATGPATGSPTPSSTETPTTSPLSIFYVAVGDAGKSGLEIGCGDSLVSTVSEPVEYTDPVEAAITHLLADKNREHGETGLVNALYQSTLKYVSSSIRNGTVTVELTGQPVSGGTCDDPRIQAQLKYTAQAAASVKEYVILIDGTPIEKFMSQK